MCPNTYTSPCPYWKFCRACRQSQYQQAKPWGAVWSAAQQRSWSHHQLWELRIHQNPNCIDLVRFPCKKTSCALGFPFWCPGWCGILLASHCAAAAGRSRETPHRSNWSKARRLAVASWWRFWYREKCWMEAYVLYNFSRTIVLFWFVLCIFKSRAKWVMRKFHMFCKPLSR